MFEQDRFLVCRDCGGQFAFTAGEQRFYTERGFHEPVRCQSCRVERRQTRTQGGPPVQRHAAPRAERQLFPAVCASCGQNTMVPFEPRSGRPVYCRECYARMR